MEVKIENGKLIISLIR